MPVEGDPSGWEKTPVYLNLGYSTILLLLSSYQLSKLSELSQKEVLTDHMGHPLVQTIDNIRDQ